MAKKTVGTVLIIIGILFMTYLVMSFINQTPADTNINSSDEKSFRLGANLGKLILAFISVGLIWFGIRMAGRKK